MIKLIDKFRKSKLAVDSAIATIGRIAIAILNFLCTLMISRSLTSAERGEYAILIASIFFFSTILNFGLPYSNMYYAIKHRDLKNYIYGNSILTLLISGLILFTFLLIWKLFFPFFIPQIPNNFIYLMLIIFFLLMNQNIRGFVIAHGGLLITSYFDFTFKLISLLVIFYLYQNHSLTLSIALWILTIEMLTGWLFHYAILSKHQYKFQLRWATFKETFRFSTGSYLLLIISIVLVKSDLFFVKHFLGLKETGIYGIMTSMIDNVTILSQVAAGLSFLKLTEMNERSEIVRKSNLSVLAIIGIISAAAAVLFPFAEDILYIFIKEDAALGVQSFRILLVASVFLSIYYFVSINILSLNKGYLWILGLLPFLGLNFTVNYYFIPIYGINFAAYSSLGTYFLVAVYCIAVMNRSLVIKGVKNFIPSKSN